MAFQVSPTSGVGPYTFTADLLNKSSFGYGYDLRFFTSGPRSGSCPLPSETANYAPSASALLLDEGVYISSTDVSVGSCRTYVLRIFDSSDNVVDEQFVQISNV